MDLVLRKKSKKIKKVPDFDELRQRPGEIDSLRIYESF